MGNRLYSLCVEITTEGTHGDDIADIQKCDMSMRKAQYIKNAGETVYSGGLDIAALTDALDAEIIERQSVLTGIGGGIAKMLVIFSLERRVGLSIGDLAIHRGICRQYGHKPLPKEQLLRYKKRFSPYGNLYL